MELKSFSVVISGGLQRKRVLTDELSLTVAEEGNLA